MALGFWLLLAALTAQQPPAPQPFPRPGQQPARPAPQAPPPPQSQPASPPPATTATPPPGSEAPPNSSLGVPLYPGAQFLSSFDAGRGQRYFWFGSAASFVEVVAFYRGALKQKGDLVFDAPATHEFDVGRFKEETMAFPPGVTVKDFHSEVSQGYPNPKPGGQPARFATIIQIVPPQ
jgi:hypothetical protein